MRKTKQIAITTYIICFFISANNISQAESLKIIPLNNTSFSIENQKILDRIYYNKNKTKNKKQKKVFLSKMPEESFKTNLDYDTIKVNNNFFIEVKKPNKRFRKKYQLYQQAYAAISSEQYELAILLYNKILKVKPKDELSLSSIALSYQKLGDIESAKKIYAKTIKLYPNNTNTINNYLILIATEHPKEALNELLKLDQLFNYNHKLKAQISYLYAKQAKYLSALDYINEALKIDKNEVTYLNNKAVILEYLGNKSQANKIYNKIYNKT
jgi:Flp pilus assembly protein TadD